MSSDSLACAPRFTYIDGLRGIAAMAVVFHHLVYNTELAEPLVSVLPHALSQVALRGFLGVIIFFVISGFVIAYSLRSTLITGGEIGNFIIRRQLRLDPPYWCVLGIVLIQSAVGQLIPSPVEHPLPTIGEVALNAAYLQKLTGSRELLGVAWTLCIEIQFYLIFIVLLAVAAIGRTCRKPSLAVASVLALLTGIASAFFAPDYQWYGPYWHYFAAGALCCWSLQSRAKLPVILLAVLSLVVSATVFTRTGVDAAVITGLITVWSIYVFGRTGHLLTLLRQSVFLYFGRISYSLYLVHLPVLMVVMQLGQKLTGTRPIAALGWMLLAWMLCIAAADVFFRIIERPSMQMASTFKRQRVAAAPKANAPGPAAAAPIASGSFAFRSAATQA